MAGNPAKQGNAIAEASLAESRRQYAEQKAEKERTKANAKANAAAMQISGTQAYANTLQDNNNFNAGLNNFSLINTSAGTASVLNTLIGGDQASTLGG